MNIQKVVEKFNSEIMKMDNIRSEFCVSPEKDFTRDRKISFASVIRSILSFSGGTLTSELLKINKFTPDYLHHPPLCNSAIKYHRELFLHCFL